MTKYNQHLANDRILRELMRQDSQPNRVRKMNDRAFIFRDDLREPRKPIANTGDLSGAK